MNARLWGGLLLCILPHSAQAQSTSEDAPFSRKNSWTVFEEYSNTSSHMVLGTSRQREFVTLGGGYTRRLARFWGTELGYHGEVRPVIFEGDPLTLESYTDVSPTGVPLGGFNTTFAPISKCMAASTTTVIPPSPGLPSGDIVHYSATCGRQWTFAQSLSPFGFKYSLRVRRRVQPYIIGTLGYMYSSRAIPVSDAESFNFVFDVGAGIELYNGNHRSVSVETRLQHFSNNFTAPANPGVDNIMYGLSYSFGH